MAGKSDPQRRPVLYDLKNQRFLVDPLIGGAYPAVPIPAAASGVIDGGDFDSGTSAVPPPPP